MVIFNHFNINETILLRELDLPLRGNEKGGGVNTKENTLKKIFSYLTNAILEMSLASLSMVYILKFGFSSSQQ